MNWDTNKKTAIAVAVIILIIGVVGYNKDQEKLKRTNKEVESTQGAETYDYAADSEEPKNKEIYQAEECVFDSGSEWPGNDCNISVLSGDKDKIVFLIENNSMNNYQFDIYGMSVDGLMTDCNIVTTGASVPAGKKIKFEIKFEDRWKSGGENIGYIEIRFSVINTEEYTSFYTDVLEVRTNYFNGHRSFENNQEIYELNGIEIVQNNLNSLKASYSVINNSDMTIKTNIDNCSVNEWAFEPVYSSHNGADVFAVALDGYDIVVFPNNMANIDIDISGFVSENGIEEVESFEFQLDIIPEENYFEQWSTESITLKNSDGE